MRKTLAKNRLFFQKYKAGFFFYLCARTEPRIKIQEPGLIRFNLDSWFFILDSKKIWDYNAG